MTVALGGSTLAYSLYSDAALTSVRGDAIGTNTVPGTGSGGTQNLMVYGRLPSGQNVAAGAYADEVTVTLTYRGAMAG